MKVQQTDATDRRTDPNYIPKLSEVIDLTQGNNTENFMNMVENGSSFEKCKLWATVIRYLPTSYYFSDRFIKNATAKPRGSISNRINAHIKKRVRFPDAVKINEKDIVENFMKAINSPEGTTDELSKFNQKLYEKLQHTCEDYEKTNADLNMEELEYQERAKMHVIEPCKRVLCSLTKTKMNINTSIGIQARIGGKDARLNLYPDLSIALFDGRKIWLGEIKRPSLQKVTAYLDFLSSESLVIKKKKQDLDDQEHDSVAVSIIDQTASYLMITKTPIGILSDSFTYIFIRILDLKIFNDEIHLRLEYTCTKSSSTLNTEGTMSPLSTLLALSYEEVKKSKLEIALQEARLYGDTSALLKKDYLDSIFCEAAIDNFHSYTNSYFEVMAKSGIQRRFNEKFAAANQSLGYHTVYIDRGDLVGEGISRSIQTDFFQNSQVFRVKIKELKDAGFSIKDNNEKHLILKIFDAQKYMINMESRMKPTEVIRKMVSHFSNEYMSYKLIDLFNGTNKHKKISKLNAYGFAFFRVYFKPNDKLKDPHSLENYFAVGPGFLAEELTEKPETVQDFVEGAKQLLHMHEGGVYHHDIKLSNVFMRNTEHKKEFVFIDYGLSEIECTPEEKGRPKSSGGIDWSDFETLVESMGIEKTEWERALSDMGV